MSSIPGLREKIPSPPQLKTSLQRKVLSRLERFFRKDELLHRIDAVLYPMPNKEIILASYKHGGSEIALRGIDNKYELFVNEDKVYETDELNLAISRFYQKMAEIVSNLNDDLDIAFIIFGEKIKSINSHQLIPTLRRIGNLDGAESLIKMSAEEVGDLFVNQDLRWGQTKIYISSKKEVPQGVQVREGPRGGLFYISSEIAVFNPIIDAELKKYSALNKLSPRGSRQLVSYIDSLPKSWNKNSLERLLWVLNEYSALADMGKGFSDERVDNLFDIVQPLSSYSRFEVSELVDEAKKHPIRLNKVIAIDSFIQMIHDRGGYLPHFIVHRRDFPEERYRRVVSDLDDIVLSILEEISGESMVKEFRKALYKSEEGGWKGSQETSLFEGEKIRDKTKPIIGKQIKGGEHISETSNPIVEKIDVIIKQREGLIPKKIRETVHRGGTVFIRERIVWVRPEKDPEIKVEDLEYPASINTVEEKQKFWEKICQEAKGRIYELKTTNYGGIPRTDEEMIYRGYQWREWALKGKQPWDNAMWGEIKKIADQIGYKYKDILTAEDLLNNPLLPDIKDIFGSSIESDNAITNWRNRGKKEPMWRFINSPQGKRWKIRSLRELWQKIRVLSQDKVEEFYPGFINLIGIESPGFTSALSIAKIVNEMVESKKIKIPLTA